MPIRRRVVVRELSSRTDGVPHARCVHEREAAHALAMQTYLDGVGMAVLGPPIYSKGPHPIVLAWLQVRNAIQETLLLW